MGPRGRIPAGRARIRSPPTARKTRGEQRQQPGQGGRCRTRPDGGTRNPPTGRKSQDDGHEWAEDRAAHSLSVVLFTSRTMVAGVGMRYDGTPVRQPSPGRTGDLSWRGSTRKSGIGGRHGPGTPASGSRPPCPSHRRSLSQPVSLTAGITDRTGPRTRRAPSPPETPGSPAPPRSAARQRFPARKG